VFYYFGSRRYHVLYNLNTQNNGCVNRQNVPQYTCDGWTLREGMMLGRMMHEG